MVKLYNLARVISPTPGTAVTISLGAAVASCLTFAGAGVQNGDTVRYAIEDGIDPVTGIATSREVGTGVYSSAGPSLTRSVITSTNSNLRIGLSGQAQVFISIAAEDFIDKVNGTTGSGAVVLANTPTLISQATISQTTAASNAVLTLDNSTVAGGYSATVTYKNSARTWSAGAGGAAGGLDAAGYWSLHNDTLGTYAAVVDSTNRVALGTPTIAGAWLSLPAATTTNANINLPSGTAKSSPLNGDLWYTGSKITVRNGSTSRDLLWSAVNGADFDALAPNNVVVHPSGTAPVTTGHYIPWLDNNVVWTGDYYGIISSDPQAVPTYITLSGTPANETVSLTVTFNGVTPQVVSFATTNAMTLDQVANGLVAAIMANSTLLAHHILALKDPPSGKFEVGSYWNDLPIFSAYTSTGTSASIVEPIYRSALSGAINSAVTALTVTGHSGWPGSGSYPIQIDNEVMLVTAGAGTNNWTVTRAYAGTTAASHSNGAVVWGIPALDASPQWFLQRQVTNRPGRANDIVAYEIRGGYDSTATSTTAVTIVSSITNPDPTAFQGAYLIYTSSTFGGAVQSTPAALFANGLALGDSSTQPQPRGYGTIDLTPVTGQYYVGGYAALGRSGSSTSAINVAGPAAPANGLEITGSAAGAAVSILPVGSDTDININLGTKGAGVISLLVNGHTALRATNSGVTGVNFLTVTQAATLAPVVLTVDGETNVGFSILPKGSGTLKLNGLTLTASTGTITVTNAKTLSVPLDATVSGTNTGDGNVATTAVSTSASFFPLFVASSTNSTQVVNLGTGLSFNPSTNVLTTTTFSGALSGNATTATTASNGATVQVSTSASFFPLFAASSTNGNQPFNLGTGLSFNPSTNVLTTTTFSGALSGNATTATTATSATTVAITDDTTTNATMYPTWVTTASGNQAAKVCSTKLFFNPSTGTLTATQINLAATSAQLVFQSAGVTGTLSWAPATSNKTITLPNGTTDFTATGGTNFYLKQNSAGGAITVAQPAVSQMSDYTAPTSWTPSITFGGSATGITYSTQVGYYTKVGKIVCATGFLVMTSKGAQTGAAVLNGLPVATNSTANVYHFMGFGYYQNMTSVTAPIGRVAPGGTTATLASSGSGNSTDLDNTNFQNTTNLIFTITYITD